MSAPAYAWEFNSDLFGNRTPKIITLEAAASLETKPGTLLAMSSGQVIAATDGSGKDIIGLAVGATAAALSAGDPVQLQVLFPGAVIKGKAVSTAAALAGFTSKVVDLDADGRLDPTDTTGGGLSVWRTEDSGLTVYAIVTTGAIIG